MYARAHARTHTHTQGQPQTNLDIAVNERPSPLTDASWSKWTELLIKREMAAKHVPVDTRTKKTVVMSRPHSMLPLRDVEGEKEYAGERGAVSSD